MHFHGLTRTFSTKNEAQYEEIGAFWDEMAEKYGRENLRGLGYGWTEDTIEYAIGLKEGRLEDSNCFVWLPEENWITVRGKTAELGKLYARIYEEGSLTFELETFTEDGECEISYFRETDEWLGGQIETDIFIFDHARCTAFIPLKDLNGVTLASNFIHVGASSIKWEDEASHGMCTHRCTKEEVAVLYEIIKDADPSGWHCSYIFGRKKVTAEMKEKLLELIRGYLGTD